MICNVLWTDKVYPTRVLGLGESVVIRVCIRMFTVYVSINLY